MKEVAVDSNYEKKCEEEKKKYHGFDKYEAEDFCRSLEDAGKVLSDKKKLAAANVVMNEKKKGFESIEAMKKYAAKGESEE